MGRTQPLIAALSLVALVVAGVATAAEHDNSHRNTDVVLPAGTGSPSPIATPRVITPPARTSTAVPKDNGGEYLAITGPASGAIVGRDVTVVGKARVFEAQFTVDVTQNGVVVQSQHVTASIGAPSMGVWSAVFHLAPGNYKVEAYELSAKGDGSKSATDTIWITVR
jgi:hypothetical protein